MASKTTKEVVVKGSGKDGAVTQGNMKTAANFLKKNKKKKKGC